MRLQQSPGATIVVSVAGIISLWSSPSAHEASEPPLYSMILATFFLSWKVQRPEGEIWKSVFPTTFECQLYVLFKAQINFAGISSGGTHGIHSKIQMYLHAPKSWWPV